jgi:hypothetical protein
MALLFRLPLMLFELLLRRLFGRGQDDDLFAVAPEPPESASSAAPPTPAPAPSAPQFTGAATNGTPPPPTAEEAIARRVEREAAEAAPATVAQPEPDLEPPTPLRPVPDLDDADHVDTEPTIVESFGPADDVGGTITIAEPWPGYDSDAASAIITRLRGADPATKGVVGLYEAANKGRKTILKAAG